MSFTTSGTALQALLGLRLPPVAIAFRESAPANMQRIEAPAPAGCGYWRPRGRRTHVLHRSLGSLHVPSRCPYSWNRSSSRRRPGVERSCADDGPNAIHQNGRDSNDPAPAKPVSRCTLCPAIEASFEPDVVLVRGTAKQLMLVAEAAQATGVANGGATMGRPTCAILPESLQSGLATASFGCIGNRVYTGPRR